MKTGTNILGLILVISASFASGQTFDKTFQGRWGSTYWLFQFRTNGTYTRTSTGHYGNTTVNGTYQINSDTVRILNGFKSTNGTVNERYLLSNDTLIDINLRYDYAPMLVPGLGSYNSKIKDIKYPQTQSNNSAQKIELEHVINMALNHEKIVQYYHFDKVPNRKLIIQKYYYLDAAVTVGSFTALYKPKNEINEDFYIEFEDINLNGDDVSLVMELHGERARAYLNYVKKNGKWGEVRSEVFEN